MSLAAKFIGKVLKFNLGATAMKSTITDATEITSATNANKAIDGLKKNIKAGSSYLILVIKQ
jgi:hypothetical protein